MTAAKVLSAGDRLVAAPAAIKRCEHKIDAAMERRRAILREHDANALIAIQVDRELGALKLLRQRLIDQQTELGRGAAVVPTAAPERVGWTWPTTLADATAALAEIQPDLLRLRSIPRNDRHAGHDKHQDFLVQREYALLRLIESMQPKNMTAA